MMANALKAKLLVVALFLLGGVTGALVENLYETRWNADADSAPEKKSQREVNQVYDFLDLTAEQRQQWKKIMEDSKPEFDKLFEENRRLTEHNQPKFDALREETRSRIRAILSEEQREKYNEYNERRMQRQSQSRP